jgi:uncharacterized protein YndB with AHSA1/START domain/DNA-binding transcriptional ArsR family regulator
MDLQLRAIANPTRRRILALARDRRLCAGDIARHFRGSRPGISQHLRVLVEAGLLQSEASGTRRLYRTDAAALQALGGALSAFWQESLVRLEQYLADRPGPVPVEQGRPAMETTDSVRQETLIDADAATVFAFLTDADRLTRWMGVSASVEPHPGGLYLVDMGNGMIVRGEFKEVVPVSRIAYSFGWDSGGKLPPGGSLVEIDLIPQNGGTLVRLTHSGLPADLVEPHTIGWAHYYARLAVAAAGGDPGPDPRVKPKEAAKQSAKKPAAKEAPARKAIAKKAAARRPAAARSAARAKTTARRPADRRR